MTSRRAALALLLVAIIGAVLASYYYFHKPVTPAEALAFAQTLANVVVALALVVLAGGLGSRLLRVWVGPRTAGAAASETESVVVELGLGLGVMALGLLGLGLLRLYYPIVAWALAGLLFLFLWRDSRTWCAGLARTVRALAPVGRLAQAAAAFTLLILAVGFLRALAPPLMWDALVYHLTLPALYTRTHGLQVSLADFTFFSGMPQLTEMLYTAAGLLRVEPVGASITAQLLGWCFGAALSLGLAASAHNIGLPAWLAPAILFSAFSISSLLAWAYVDLLLMLLALSVLLALREWRRQQAQAELAWRWLALAGLLAGFACGCKYTGVIVPLAGVVVVMAGALSGAAEAWRARLALALRSSSMFSILAGVGFAPWLLKNWLFTGSPVYPLLWPSADVDSLQQWFYNRPDLAEPVTRAATILLRATFLGVQGGNNYDSTLGPLLLLCAGLLVFDWRCLGPELQRELAPLLVFVSTAYVAWVLFSPFSYFARQPRLFYAFLPPLALLGSAGLAGLRGLDTPALRVSLVVKAVFLLVVGLGTIEVLAEFANQNPLPYLAGAQTAADFTAARLGWYQPALERVNTLPAGSRVIFLWEARSLPCTGPIICVPDVIIDRWWHLRRTVAAAQSIIGQWRAQGATHVLIYDTGARFIQASSDNGYDPSDWNELARLRDQLRVVATFGDAYTLYALP